MKRINFLFRISMRNVFRNKRRTLLTLTILAMGSVGLILVGGFFDNIMGGLREQFIHSQTGHIQFNARGYYKKGAAAPLDYLMKDVSGIQREIEANPHVTLTVPRLKFGGMASSENTSIPVMALGVDPDRERRMGNYQYRDALQPSINITAGRDLDAADDEGVIVGKGLLEALGLKVGDPLNFITTRGGGAIDGSRFYVRGTFETTMKDFDDHTMKMGLASAQGILGVSGEVHSLLVLLDATESTDSVRAALDARLAAKGFPLESITWHEQGRFYRQAKALLDKIYQVITLIISVVFFFSIANTVNMSLFERMREFGTMMAVGNSRTSIFSTIFLETSLIGILGAVGGIALGSGIAVLVSSIGIEMPPPPQGGNGYYAMIALSPPLLIATFVTAAVSTLLSSIVPGYRVCHLRVVEALGYV